MSKDLTKLSKKELKDYINKNGFYFHMNCDTIKQEEVSELLKSDKVTKTGVELPKEKDVIIYKGIASQNY